MKFRYYIIDLTEGTIIGTEQKRLADHYAVCDDFFRHRCERWIESHPAMRSHVVSSNIAVCLFEIAIAAKTMKSWKLTSET